MFRRNRHPGGKRRGFEGRDPAKPQEPLLDNPPPRGPHGRPWQRDQDLLSRLLRHRNGFPRQRISVDMIPGRRIGSPEPY